MQHTINNTTVRNGFIALLQDLVKAHAQLAEAKRQVQAYIAKHKLTREQAKPYVMTYCANKHGVPLFDDYTFATPQGHKLPAEERAKLPAKQQAAIKSWMAAKADMKRIFDDAGLATVKPATKRDKVDPVEQEVAAFYKALKSLSPAALKIVRRETGLSI